MNHHRYFLAVDLGDEEPLWQEVTKEKYVNAERAAGFRSKFGNDQPATAAFSAGGVRGRIEYL